MGHFISHSKQVLDPDKKIVSTMADGRQSAKPIRASLEITQQRLQKLGWHVAAYNLTRKWQDMLHLPKNAATYFSYLLLPVSELSQLRHPDRVRGSFHWPTFSRRTGASRLQRDYKHCKKLDWTVVRQKAIQVKSVQEKVYIVYIHWPSLSLQAMHSNTPKSPCLMLLRRAWRVAAQGWVLQFLTKSWAVSELLTDEQIG